MVEGGTIAQARNEGIRRSRGRLVAFIDSDCVAEEHWLSKLTGAIGSLADAGGVGGGILPRRGSVFQDAVGYVYGSYLGSLGSTSLAKAKSLRLAKALSTSNALYLGEALTRAEGFDERYLINEDTELSRRVKELGYKLYFTLGAEVHQRMEGSLREICEKFVRWGASRTRSTLTNLAHFHPRVAALLLLTLYSLWLAAFHPYLFSLIAAFYLLLILAYGLHYTLRGGSLRVGCVIPLVFLTQHLSYGAGLMVGALMGPYRERKPFTGFRVLHHEYPAGRLDESAF